MKNLREAFKRKPRYQVRGIGNIVEPVASSEKTEQTADNTFTTTHRFYLTAILEAKMREILDPTRDFSLLEPED